MAAIVIDVHLHGNAFTLQRQRVEQAVFRTILRRMHEKRWWMVGIDSLSECSFKFPARTPRNEPARVSVVGETLAAVCGASVEQVARVTSDNARTLFRLDAGGGSETAAE